MSRRKRVEGVDSEDDNEDDEGNKKKNRKKSTKSKWFEMPPKTYTPIQLSKEERAKSISRSKIVFKELSQMRVPNFSFKENSKDFFVELDLWNSKRDEIFKEYINKLMALCLIQLHIFEFPVDAALSLYDEYSNYLFKRISKNSFSDLEDFREKIITFNEWFCSNFETTSENGGIECDSVVFDIKVETKFNFKDEESNIMRDEDPKEEIKDKNEDIMKDEDQFNTKEEEIMGKEEITTDEMNYINNILNEEEENKMKDEEMENSQQTNFLTQVSTSETQNSDKMDCTKDN